MIKYDILDSQYYILDLLWASYKLA